MTVNNLLQDDILDNGKDEEYDNEEKPKKSFSWIQVLIMKLRKYASIERDGYFQIYDKDGNPYLSNTIHW